MILLGLLLVTFAASKEDPVDLDNADTVFIETSGSILMKITSNPTTGYSWNLTPSTSGVFEITNSNGVYVPPNGRALGASGHQIFEVKCTEKCNEGYQEKITLIYARSWEQDPARIKIVTVNVTGNHRDYN